MQPGILSPVITNKHLRYLKYSTYMRYRAHCEHGRSVLPPGSPTSGMVTYIRANINISQEKGLRHQFIACSTVDKVLANHMSNACRYTIV